MKFIPSVIHAEYRGGFLIHLTFNDLSERTVDFDPWLKGPVFTPLKNLKQFQAFFVDGGTIAWPNGADIAPETLYEAAAYAPPGSKRSSLGAPKPRVRRRASGTRY